MKGLILSVLLLCVLLIVGIFACDRVFFRMGEVMERLDRIERRLADGVPAARTAESTAVAAEGEFANAEYFDPRREYDGVLTLAVGADVPNLNMLTSSEAGASAVFGFCTHTLGERNWGDLTRFEPVLAESWSVSEDGMTYRIKLRDGIAWHDFTDPETGREFRDVKLTADDFAFFFEALNHPEVNCAPLRVYYQDMKEFRVLNDLEFEVVWAEPYFRSEELTLGISPLPRHYYCPDGIFDPERFNYDAVRNSGFIGVGPYRLGGRERDVSITLVRNEKYFGDAYGVKPGLREIVFKIVKLENPRLQGLLAGELDMVDLTPDQWVNRTGRKPFAATLRTGEGKLDASLLPESDGRTPLVRCQTGGGSYSYIAWNLRNPLFADRRVRQALTMLVDRRRILKDVYFDLGEVAKGPFTPGTPGDDPELQPWPFDPAAAVRLLAEAGWRDTDGDGYLDRDGVKFSFTIMQVANNPSQEKILPIIREEMARAGIEMRIDIYEWSVFLNRIDERKFEACMLAWTVPLESDPYQVWHSSQAELPESSNFIGFRNAEADRIIEAIRRCTDAEERAGLCREFQNLLHEEQPYTFMFVPSKLFAISGKFNNIRIFPPYIMPEIALWRP